MLKIKILLFLLSVYFQGNDLSAAYIAKEYHSNCFFVFQYLLRGCLLNFIFIQLIILVFVLISQYLF